MSRLAWVYGDGIHLTVAYISLLFKFQSLQWCCRVMIDARCAALHGMRGGNMTKGGSPPW